MKILATIFIIATIYISGSNQCGIPGIVCEGRHHDAIEPALDDYPQHQIENPRRFASSIPQFDDYPLTRSRPPPPRPLPVPY